jgi:hypothetical protein
MRIVLVGLLAAALTANAVLIADQLVGGGRLLPRVPAEEAGSPKESPPTPSMAEAQAREAEATFRELIAEAAEQKRALERRAAELAERERQVVVLRRELAGVAPARTNERPREGLAAARPADGDFGRVARAFGGMSPENAARALLELYSRDRRVAVDLALGLPPARAAAVLDAVAQTRPSVAADIALAAAGPERAAR